MLYITLFYTDSDINFHVTTKDDNWQHTIIQPFIRDVKHSIYPSQGKQLTRLKCFPFGLVYIKHMNKNKNYILLPTL
jgi:hypothetical protein